MPQNGELKQQILEFLKTHQIEGGWKPKILALKLSKILKKDINPDSVYTILSRLSKDPESNVKKVSRGFYSYVGEPELDIEDIIFQRPVHEQIPKIHNLTLIFNPKKLMEWLEAYGITSKTKLDEYRKTWTNEKFVRKFVRNETEENTDENLHSDHKLKEIFLKSNKEKVGLSTILPTENIKPFPIELKVNPFILADPFHEDSLFQRYKFTTPHPQEIKGGHQESFLLPENRKMDVQIFGTGTVMIFIKMSENPADIIDLNALIHGFLEAFFILKFNYSFSDLSPLFFVSRCEFNYDKEKVEAFTSEIPYGIRSVTASELDNWTMQIYEKYLNGETIIREEYAYTDWEKPQPINTFEQTVAMLHMGGMTQTQTVMTLKDIHNTMIEMKEKDEKQDNILQFLLKTTQKQGSDMQRMAEIIEKQNKVIEALLKKMEREAG